MDKDVFRILRYAFAGAIIIFIAFVLCFILVFNSLFIMDDADAVPTGGAGVVNPSKFAGDIDVDTGKIYLGATTTPSLGIHDEHGVIYPKADTKLYYLYDKTGEVEKEIRLDTGTGVTTTQRVLVRIEENGEGDALVVYYVDKTYVDGILTTISNEGSYEVNVLDP